VGGAAVAAAFNQLSARGGRYAVISTQPKERTTMTHGLIMWLIIGAIAGWLAGLLVKGGGFGLIVDIIVGIVGAVIGGWLAGLLGISIGSGFIGSVIVAVIGAVILLFVIRLFRRAA
jgi:uncharacterized membrane protein YeaQ/YmgE (transglycosylase-associated protein family)